MTFMSRGTTAAGPFQLISFVIALKVGACKEMELWICDTGRTLSSCSNALHRVDKVAQQVGNTTSLSLPSNPDTTDCPLKLN